MARTALLFLFILSGCSGLALHSTYKNGTNTTLRYSLTPPQRWAAENGGEEVQAKDEILCVRMHNNTALVGAEPFARLLLHSAKDCRRNCIEMYPKCVAVMFYYLHEESENHVCYMFDKNSVSKNVALIAEKPLTPQDRIRLLEIVPDCHDFDAFPPMSESFASSTDKVPLRKRSSGYFYYPKIYGTWSTWSPCHGSIAHQVRTRPCEYGQYVHRRTCPHATMIAAQPLIPSYSLPHYPPERYHLPVPHMAEHQLLMAHHAEQYQTACCNKWHLYKSSCPGNQPCALPVPAPCAHPCPPAPVIMIVSPNAPPITVPSHPTPPHNNTVECPQWSVWSEWSACSATCGIAVQQRCRTCADSSCEGPFSESRQCENLPPCEEWGEWGHWGECSVTCGRGERNRWRVCLLGERQCDGSEYETEYCDMGFCSDEGHWDSWTEWSSCSVTCGHGYKSRQRSCQGEFCRGTGYEEVLCEMPACSYWSEWYEWSQCSVSCGEGTKKRERVCIGGYCEGDSKEELDCMEQKCAEWETWSAWSSCSATCGEGVRTRERLCTGEFCGGATEEAETCTAESRVCTFSREWTEWSHCSVSCGTGKQTRSRICIGDDCPLDLMDERECTGDQCEDMWDEWGTWSACSTECGVGEKIRRRQCKAQWAEDVTTTSCQGPATETVACVERACCSWSSWTEWCPCSHDCGGGQRIRSRVCGRPGYPRDATCKCAGEGIERESCNTYRCSPTPPPGDAQIPPRNETAWHLVCGLGYCLPPGIAFQSRQMVCQWMEWYPWSQCTSQCGVPGVIQRFRICSGDHGCFCHGDSMQQAPCMQQKSCSYH